MAHSIPDQILDFDKASREDVILNALKNGLGDDYWVFHSLSVNQTSTNGVFYEKEIDFVVYHREKGILCIEAKNGADISFTTYRKFKGLDAAAVVLVDVGADAFCGNHAAMPFYEGASRARQKLAVFASMTDDDCAKVLRHFEAEKRYFPTAASETGRDEFARFLKLERRRQGNA